MASLPSVNLLLLANLIALGILSVYLLTKITRNRSVLFLIASLIPLMVFQAGSYLFVRLPASSEGAKLVVVGLALLPLGFAPMSHTLGRRPGSNHTVAWSVYYTFQFAVMILFINEIVSGHLVEWVTGILNEPIILIGKRHRLLFLNLLASGAVVLLCLDSTLRNVASSQLESLKFVFIAFLGLVVYFSYLSVNILISSYISQSVLLAGSALISLSLLLLCYSFAKFPFWEVKVSVSRRLVFGCLSASGLIIYLVISGSILDNLKLAQPQLSHVLLPVTVFSLVGLLLAVYLSPGLRATVASFISTNFFRNKYDYRDLWMKFSERSSGSPNLTELLPKIGKFIADAMFVRQVAIWLRSPASELLTLEYCLDPVASAVSSSLRLVPRPNSENLRSVHHTAQFDRVGSAPAGIVHDPATLRQLRVISVVPITKGDEILGLLGIGEPSGGKGPSPEDDQLLLSISNQIGYLILNQKLSEELLLSREWESFNRFASFIIHDLKNLATLQGMTLENGKRFGTNPQFITDAFGTFHQTTEKMIDLIASLSVQRGQFSLKQQPVKIIEVIATTFDDLKIDQRNGLKVVTDFPPKSPIISGDPELLQKAFTNLLLNAIQSLPKGKGAVEVTISEAQNGRITAAIKDTGCGIPSEQLKSLFRPFQTTKKQGMGIGLCHTRSIIEVHGGQLRIESKVNAGTKVEVELPTI